MSKVIVSRSSKFPVKQEDYNSYTTKWKNSFDIAYKKHADTVSNLKSYKIAKASKDTKLIDKANDEVQALNKIFFDRMDKFEKSLRNLYDERLELELDSKDFNIVEFFKEYPGNHMIGKEKDTDNILVVLNG